MGYSPPAVRNRTVDRDGGMGRTKNMTATGTQTVTLQLPAAVAGINAFLQCSTVQIAASQCGGQHLAGLQWRTLQTAASHSGRL